MCKQSNCGVCPGEPPEDTPCVQPGLDFVNEPMVSEPVRRRLRQVVREAARRSGDPGGGEGGDIPPSAHKMKA